MALDLYMREVKERPLKIFLWIFPAFVTPNQITLVSFIFGLLSAYYASISLFYTGAIFWALNRIFDGIDGVVARARGLQSDFGGYFDIICDFMVYAIIPLALAYSKRDETLYLWTIAMEGLFFVNAASLFYLAAVIEKTGRASEKKELTSITMPTSLIEGTETVVGFSLFFLFHERLVLCFQLFSAGVAINIIHRLVWAYKKLVLDKKNRQVLPLG